MENPDLEDAEESKKSFRLKLEKLWQNSNFSLKTLNEFSTPIDTLPNEAIHFIRRGYHVINSDSKECFIQQLGKFNNYQEKFWPIVSHIVVRGNFPRLCNSGLSLLDIPGEDRASPAMYDRFVEGIKKCSMLFVLLPETRLQQTIISTWNNYDLWTCSNVSYILSKCQSQHKELINAFAHRNINATPEEIARNV